MYSLDASHLIPKGNDEEATCRRTIWDNSEQEHAENESGCDL